ncbi:thermonuclease family protein [candidate division WOR-3 bacterium]|nr:thermonuclease family protein [candidate division WOR-3 bacterium]
MKTRAGVLLLLAAATLPAVEVTVASVPDGATFVAGDGTAIGLLGISAPRLFEPGGDVSRDVLEKHLRGRKVRLEEDAVAEDSLGRPLRWVFCSDTLVNALVVRKGFAAAALPELDVMLHYGDSLLKLERTAARIGKGLWPFDVFPPPSFRGPDEYLSDTAGSDPWIETVSWDETDNYYGRLVRVVGTVVATYRSDKVFIMNFHQDYRRHFKAVVFSGDLPKFPPYPEDHYKRRVVRVTGLVKEYQGAAEMILTDPGQIEILE